MSEIDGCARDRANGLCSGGAQSMIRVCGCGTCRLPVLCMRNTWRAESLALRVMSRSYPITHCFLLTCQGHRSTNDPVISMMNLLHAKCQTDYIVKAPRAKMQRTCSSACSALRAPLKKVWDFCRNHRKSVETAQPMRQKAIQGLLSRFRWSPRGRIFGRFEPGSLSKLGPEKSKDGSSGN